jgi:hypothetical protein
MKYVVECTKRVRCEDVGLGHEGWYRTGQYVTYDGRPTRSLDKAFIYGSDSRSPGSDIDEFPFEDFPHLDDYFKKVPVSVVVRVTRKRPASRRSSTARAWMLLRLLLVVIQWLSASGWFGTQRLRLFSASFAGCLFARLVS